MSEKIVNFSDKQGRKIVGTLLLPEGAGPFPAVVICHGFRGDRNQENLTEITEETSKKDIVTFRFDFTKVPGESDLPLEDMTITYELEVLDLALDFLRKIPEVNKDKIGLAGHSLGGLVVAWYAAAHPEIKSLTLLSAVYNFLIMWNHRYGEETAKEMQEKGFAMIYSTRFKRDLKMKVGFYEDAQKYDIDQVIDTLTCPILVIAGTEDEAVTLDHAQHYLDRAPSLQKELKIIRGADHNYTDPKNLEEVKTAVADWFEKTLNNP
ncbi:MAG: alpha/beta fold hydrolase [bacterium]|nr:alpha/beta fold hydrolase [bacterium]